MTNRKDPNCRRWTLALAVSLLSATSAFAGHEISSKDVKDVKGKEELPVRTWFPDFPPGYVTAGVQASEHNTGAYLDSITGIWAPKERDALLFLNSRYHWEDNHQFISSSGAGFRKLFAPGVIVGANGYYDSLHSERGNDYSQLGLGVEVLTKWVDARFNYYLPDDEHYEVDRFQQQGRDSHFDGSTLVRRKLTNTYKSYEAALEGYNAEVGFLVPGLDKYAEVRVFGGYYHYQNPFGGDFEGFKARLEARVLPGVMLDLEYWDDAALMGGHWTAGARVSVPFSIFNLVSGRNPFEGIEEQFKPRQREFNERLGEMVIRSHRIQTTTSGPQLTGRRTDVKDFHTTAPSSPGGGDNPFPPE